MAGLLSRHNDPCSSICHVESGGAFEVERITAGASEAVIEEFDVPFGPVLI